MEEEEEAAAAAYVPVLQESNDSYSSKANIYLKKAWQGLVHIMNDETQISLRYLRKEKYQIEMLYHKSTEKIYAPDNIKQTTAYCNF